MKVVALSGGVGGARLVYGLDRVLGESLTTIVNTGDDFVHWGLSVSPDVDTVLYTLADLAHVERGWGLAEESFGALAMMKRYGGEAWFALGDRDLGTHLFRTTSLARGETLTAVTERMQRALGIRSRVLPMADAARRTMIDTAEHGTLSFQEWFVRHRAAPRALRVRFEGTTVPAPEVLGALADADVVVIGPSNPYVSVDPILGLDGVRDAAFTRPLVALSPIVRGAAVKGPLAEMIRGLAAEEPSPAAVARHYAPALRGMVVERGDEWSAEGVRVLGTETLMRTRDDSVRLAREVLAFAERLA
jgi:LPPG:FO 2-phospho-L-lactate transferase